MMGCERVTVTLPIELIEQIDRIERNRSKFVAVAIRNELSRRQLEHFRASLDNAHCDAAELTELGLDDWATGYPPETEGIAERNAGSRVRWIEPHGWFKESG
jgi:post-segregation antitoxin (ccd killing protein)